MEGNLIKFAHFISYIFNQNLMELFDENDIPYPKFMRKFFGDIVVCPKIEACVTTKIHKKLRNEIKKGITSHSYTVSDAFKSRTENIMMIGIFKVDTKGIIKNVKFVLTIYYDPIKKAYTRMRISSSKSTEIID